MLLILFCYLPLGAGKEIGRDEGASRLPSLEGDGCYCCVTRYLEFDGRFGALGSIDATAIHLNFDERVRERNWVNQGL